ncbi:MAG: hypothetical protein E7G42_01005 [Serratia marcescens]|jgi:hypothetical protein|uniref:hypothetical protein n=1 Tax=Pantoea sp. PSNIH1 TaxID=1484158 RepID=UPI0011A63D3F|nr:hypothetical protein [Pantoea sp. PSNIH1]MDU3783967.1 hypothetical protein [Serratia marcescens]MDU3817816.1 hypothetical protein [Pantoea sp.]
MSQAVKHYPMPVVPAELVEPLIRFLSDREERIEFPPHMFSILNALGEEIALAALTAKPAGYTIVTGAGNTLFRKHRPRLRVTNEAPVPVYTAPPALVSTGQ